ncbi:copper chaperone for superoxide dismutase-like [Acanthaster planci]|uniref:Superoxide dismutase copper chaperone n=1 Tax=Acanthaster planci TaxID=133434 RepID=A0A8B7YIA3_ACAPL|nr:copper chaperone for superoxide dismutase-like [Acanthaster planci]
MATATKVEFAVQMTCQKCVDSIQKTFEGVDGVSSLDINLAQERVIIESILPSSQLLELLESTGRRAVVKGQGLASGKHLGAAVSVLDTPHNGPVMGVIRMVQLADNQCVIEGTVDGLTPGAHGLNIHEFGDISDGCNSCGMHFNPTNSRHGGPEDNERHNGDLGNVIADDDGRARFRMKNDRIKVWDVIGRCMVIHSGKDDLGGGGNPNSKTDGNSGPGLACGIIARSAGLFENTKKLCQCDGVSVWDERDVPLAGPSRQQHGQKQSQL